MSVAPAAASGRPRVSGAAYRLGLCLMAWASLATGGKANAQQSGYALNRFEPAERGSDWFWGESLDLRGHGRVAVGLVADWAHEPLVGDNGQGATPVVRNQLFSHLGASVTLLDRLRFGLDMPVLLLGDGTPVLLDGVRYEVEEGANVGDLRLGMDVRLVGERGEPLVLALGAQVFLPTGSRDAFTGDGQLRFAPRLSLAGDIEQLAYSVRGGVSLHALREDFAGAAYGSDVQLGATAGLRLLDERLLIGPEVWASTVISDAGAGFFQRETTPVEGLVGAHFRHGDWHFGLGMGTALVGALGSPTSRLLASAEWLAPALPPPLPDADTDLIPDAADACPNAAGVPHDRPAQNGCPPRDGDGDGIDDDADACADTPGQSAPDAKRNGCPLDNDLDTIADSVDACVSQPGVASTDRARHGCPLDADGDGVIDTADACPSQAGVPSEVAARNGCSPDEDGDTLLDAQDACPDRAGPADPDPAQNGCPRVSVTEERVTFLDRIEFDPDAPSLRDTSAPILQQIAEALTQNPQITRLRIEGHTDARGTRRRNIELGQARAEAVLQRLAALGIDTKRLVAEGVGPDRPIASNDTDEGRQKNRRVELHIVQAGRETKAP
jgi:OOP family OmpA-OmpF porin